MGELLEYLVKNITGSDEFSVNEETQGDRVTLTVTADPEIIGLIIGKEGKTVKNLRRILGIRATKENTSVHVDVTERE